MKFSQAAVAGIAAASSANALPRTAAPSVECSSLDYVDARGTSEPQVPTFGVIVGDPLWDALKKLVPDAAGYAVNYPATTQACSRETGTADVINHLNAQSKACPDQKFAIVGYSQGADVMHQALVNIDPSLYDRIVALVMFGDFGNKGSNITTPFGGMVPDFPAPLAQKLKQNCAKGDPVCSNDGADALQHLTYNDEGKTYIADSAAYIAKQLQAGGTAGPEPSPNVGPATATPENVQAQNDLGTMLGAPPGSASAAPPALTNCTAPVAAAAAARFVNGWDSK